MTFGPFRTTRGGTIVDFTQFDFIKWLHKSVYRRLQKKWTWIQMILFCATNGVNSTQKHFFSVQAVWLPWRSAVEISPSPLLLTKAKFYDSGALPYTRSRDWSPRCVMSRVTYGHPTSLLLCRQNRPFWGRLRPRGLIRVYPLTSPSVLVRQLTFFLREDKREFVRDGAIDEGTEGKVVAPPLFSSHDV